MTTTSLERARSVASLQHYRKRFLLAFACFLGWVAILLAMDLFSANRPGSSVAPTSIEQPESR